MKVRQVRFTGESSKYWNTVPLKHQIRNFKRAIAIFYLGEVELVKNILFGNEDVTSLDIFVDESGEESIYRIGTVRPESLIDDLKDTLVTLVDFTKEKN